MHLAAGSNFHQNRTLSSAVHWNLSHTAGSLLVARTACLVTLAPLAILRNLAVNRLLGGAIQFAAGVHRATFLIVFVHEFARAASGSILQAFLFLTVVRKGGGGKRGGFHCRPHGGHFGRRLGGCQSGSRGRWVCEAESLTSDLLAPISSVFLGGLGTCHVNTRVVFAGTFGTQARTNSTTDLVSTGEFGHIVSVVESQPHFVCGSVVIH